jgi:AraC family transcriptional regulator
VIPPATGRFSLPAGSNRLPVFAEAPAWTPVGNGWRPLFGRFGDLGFSLEWHDFETSAPVDWGRSFHPGSVEVCLNLDGVGEIQCESRPSVLGPGTAAFYYQGLPGLTAVRRPAIRHRFITIEFSHEFLTRHFAHASEHLHPIIAEVIAGTRTESGIASIEPMGATLLPLVDSLRHCPVFQPAQGVWFQCKALEAAALLFFRPAEGDLFCTRAQRAARERIGRARSILAANLANPPSLEELARQVGCSSFYLSRQFSAATGMTLQQYLRRIRLERAAELLRTGQCNVTEAALEVGYSSLSHFSTAFHELFGCCPGLYPRQYSPNPFPTGAPANRRYPRRP